MATSTAITTWLRVRPCTQRESHFDPPDAARAQVEVHVPEDAALGFVNNKRSNWKFAFNGVLAKQPMLLRSGYGPPRTSKFHKIPSEEPSLVFKS